MKILFVCRSNVGRSQMAMEFYNQLHPNEGASAGTKVDKPGQKLAERGPAIKVVAAMKDLGIDISGNERVQLTPAMLTQFEKIIVIAEQQAIPDWLRTNKKVEIWNVEDAKDKSIEQTRDIRDEIKVRVLDLDTRLHRKT